MSTAFEQPLAYAIDGRTLTLTHADGTIDTYTDAAPTLTGVTWQWLGTMTGEGPITVADSSRYTIEFLADGTAAIKADCNNVVAQYTAENGAMTITPGPSTLAACPEDSQADVFVQQGHRPRRWHRRPLHRPVRRQRHDALRRAADG